MALPAIITKPAPEIGIFLSPVAGSFVTDIGGPQL
jgi:hypothetical protein